MQQPGPRRVRYPRDAHHPRRGDALIEELSGVGRAHLPILTGHTLSPPEGSASLTDLAWSVDGRFLAAGDVDGAVLVWEMAPQEAEEVSAPSAYEGAGITHALKWAPTGPLLASVHNNHQLRVWDAESGSLTHSIDLPGYGWCVDWSVDGRRLAVAMQLARRGSNVQIYDLDNETWIDLDTASLHSDTVFAVAWSPDGRFLASASPTAAVVWGIGATDGRSQSPKAHVVQAASSRDHGNASHLAWAPDSSHLAISQGTVMHIVGMDRLGVVTSLEGHVGSVNGMAFSPVEKLFISKAGLPDGAARIWDTDRWVQVGELPIETADKWSQSSRNPAFHPAGSPLALHGARESVVVLLEFDASDMSTDEQSATRARSSVRYTSAKIALVGDQQVGKTTLGHRMIHGEFKLFPRTHGQQFWMFPRVSRILDDGTNCEAILWDFAGQQDYRLTHSLFLDDADLALVLFSASRREEPLKGVEYWIKALGSKRGSRCPTILVATQVDVGDVSMTTGEIAEFIARHQLEGRFVRTSAANGDGVEDLVELIERSIQWSELAPTVTTATFKLIKDFVLRLKEEAALDQVVLSSDELRQRITAMDPTWDFTTDEMIRAVGHLANHGLVTPLRTATGEWRVLLTPDLLINVTASIVLAARANPHGLGAVTEREILQGQFECRELEDLADDDQGVLLDAAISLFLRHNVCFREVLGRETLLVFPALIHQRMPGQRNISMEEAAYYQVTGSIEHLYSALVVLLGYTNTFTRVNHWLSQAEYEMFEGEICGFELIDLSEGEVGFALYHTSDTSPHVVRTFEGLFETFLMARNVAVQKFPSVRCPKSSCRYLQPRREVIRRVDEGRGYLRCIECGKKVSLPATGELLELTGRPREAFVREKLVAAERTDFAEAVARLKGLVRDRQLPKPTCFISYAWGDATKERWVARLATQLVEADVHVLLDQRDNAAFGRSIARFMSDGIEEADFIVVVGTPLYRSKYVNKVSTSGSKVAAEVDLISRRMTATEELKSSVLPLLLEGEESDAFPPLVQGRTYADFRDQSHYFTTLFDLLLTLYRVDVTDPAVSDLRDRLTAATVGGSHAVSESA